MGEYKPLTIQQKLTRYRINGKEYASSLQDTPAPEQNPKAPHWSCQVNETTNEFDILR